MTLAQKNLHREFALGRKLVLHGFPKFENIFVKMFTIVGDFEIL